MIAIKHYPSLNWVQANLGLFYWLKGDIKNSKLYYSEAIRQIVSVQDPDNMEALVKDIYDAQAKYPNITNFPELITFLENELLLSKYSNIEIVMASTKFLKFAISNDSGVSHMLSTNYCPLIKLFGPKDYVRVRYIENASTHTLSL